VVLLEGVGDVLQEDQTQDDVLVFGGIHGAPQGVGGLPELGLQAAGGDCSVPPRLVCPALGVHTFEGILAGAQSRTALLRETKSPLEDVCLNNMSHNPASALLCIESLSLFNNARKAY
jgi:hypothetical protein